MNILKNTILIFAGLLASLAQAETQDPLKAVSELLRKTEQAYELSRQNFAAAIRLKETLEKERGIAPPPPVRFDAPGRPQSAPAPAGAVPVRRQPVAARAAQAPTTPVAIKTSDLKLVVPGKTSAVPPPPSGPPPPAENPMARLEKGLHRLVERKAPAAPPPPPHGAAPDLRSGAQKKAGPAQYSLGVTPDQINSHFKWQKMGANWKEGKSAHGVSAEELQDSLKKRKERKQAAPVGPPSPPAGGPPVFKAKGAQGRIPPPPPPGPAPILTK